MNLAWKEKIERITTTCIVYFANTDVTPEVIHEAIDMFRPDWETVILPEDESAFRAELFSSIESKFSVTINGEITQLNNDEGHQEWFNENTDAPLKREFDWHFWDHYKIYLHQKGWAPNVIESLTRFSSIVLSKIEDPCREGAWDRRGMVVGSVQSGKTANYTALITKAADAGYKLIVVLTGVHNSLRKQTQERINEEFIGYSLEEIGLQETKVGVGKMFMQHNAVYTLTSSAPNGDFKINKAEDLGVFPTPETPPFILVIKKHTSILKNVITWANKQESISDIPLLLIDDECDFASVNTKRVDRDEYGNVSDEWDPTKTNLLIRKLLQSFSKKIYVGYTATPYANIFIDNDDHLEYGPDLFPKHFLVNLPVPSNYVGPEKLFGLEADKIKNIDEIRPLPLIRNVLDYSKFIPDKHKKDHYVKDVPESLKNALNHFVLVCATRRIRRTGNPHNTMLIHVTRFTHVQQQIYEKVESILKSLVQRIRSGNDALKDLESIWIEDFVKTSNEMKDLGYQESDAHSWEDLREVLYKTILGIKILQVNGEVGDILQYEKKK